MGFFFSEFCAFKGHCELPAWTHLPPLLYECCCSWVCLAAVTQCSALSQLWLCTVDRKLPRTFASFYLLSHPPPPHSFLNDSFLWAVPAPRVVTRRRERLQGPCFAPPEFQCLLSHVSLLGLKLSLRTVIEDVVLHCQTTAPPLNWVHWFSTGSSQVQVLVMNQKWGGSTPNAWYSRGNKSCSIARAVANSLTLEFNSIGCTQEPEDLGHSKGKCSRSWIFIWSWVSKVQLFKKKELEGGVELQCPRLVYTC